MEMMEFLLWLNPSFMIISAALIITVAISTLAILGAYMSAEGDGSAWCSACRERKDYKAKRKLLNIFTKKMLISYISFHLQRN